MFAYCIDKSITATISSTNLVPHSHLYREKFQRFKLLDEEKYQAVLALHRDDLAKLQCELNESQEFIFGNAIGCSRAASSINSDVTCPEEIQSCTTNEAKVNDTDTTDEAKVECTVDFGLECDKNNSSDRSEEWHQAESLMSNYRAVLQKREELNSQAHSLNAQNKVLEGELTAKLEDSVNEELTFPPAKVIPSLEEEKTCRR